MKPSNTNLSAINSQAASRRARRTRRTLRECAGGVMLTLGAVLWTGGMSESTQASDVRPTAEQAAPSPRQENPVKSVAPVEAKPGADDEAVKSDAAKSEAAPSSAPSSSSVGPRELSTQPLIDRPRVVIDRSKRPQWVEQPPVRTGDVHTSTVSSGPFATQRGALDRLDDELQAGVSAYIEEYLESPDAGKQIVYSAKEIRRRLVKEPIYLEYGEFEGLGTMQDAHAQLVFDSTFRVELEERWRQIRTLARLIHFSAIAGGILVLLGVSRIALRGRGKKSEASTASLKLTTGTAILGVLGVSVLIAAKLLLV